MKCEHKKYIGTKYYVSEEKYRNNVDVEFEMIYVCNKCGKIKGKNEYFGIRCNMD